MSSWAERVHRRAADLSSVVTLCGHPGSSAAAYPYRLEKVKFGVLLEEVCKSNDNIPGPLLVLILKLNKESPNRRDVFRAPGHQGAMKKLIHFLQAGRLVNVDNYSVYTIASVLKKFLRKIPYGIFGRTGEKELFEIIELENETEQTERLHRLFTSLPKYTQHLLVLLFGTFRVIASNAVHAGTGMTSEAIGVSVAPSFFQSCVSDGKTARMEDVLKFKVATKIVKHVIDRFATNDIFGRDNYEYYARVTGRILKVQDEWICSFQYPPPPREKLAQQKYALQHSLEAEKTWLQCQCERWGSLAQEESRSTPALLTSSSSALDNSVISLGLTPEHSLFESCARLSVSLEGPGLFVLTSSPVSKTSKHGSVYNDFGNDDDDGDDEDDDDEGDDDELDGFLNMSTNSKSSHSHYQNVWDHSESTDKIGFVTQTENLHPSNSDDGHHHHHHHYHQNQQQNCSGGNNHQRVAMCTKKKSKKVRNANCMSAAAATTATTATAVAINASLIGNINLMRDIANDDTSVSASATMLNKSLEQFDYIDKCCDSSDLMAVKRRYRQNKQKKITQRLQYPRRSRVCSKNQDGCEHNVTTTTTTTSDSNTNINNLNRDSKQIVDVKATNKIFMIKSNKTPISSTSTKAKTTTTTNATATAAAAATTTNSKNIASNCNSNILNNSGYCSRCYHRGLRYSSICSTRSTNNESYDHKATDNLTMTELHAINHYAWSAKSLSYLPQVRDDYLLASRISV